MMVSAEANTEASVIVEMVVFLHHSDGTGFSIRTNGSTQTHTHLNGP